MESISNIDSGHDSVICREMEQSYRNEMNSLFQCVERGLNDELKEGLLRATEMHGKPIMNSCRNYKFDLMQLTKENLTLLHFATKKANLIAVECII